MQYEDSEIVNADETCWRIINGVLKTISLKGSDQVNVNINFDIKSSVTVMAACTLSGRKLPLMLIAKGKTKKCEDKYVKDPRLRKYINKSLFIDHTPDGWSTNSFVLNYLKFLKKQMDQKPFYLIWDLHASHRHELVKAEANNLNINLSFIPAGQTDRWQPLDCSIFGIVKKQSVNNNQSQSTHKDSKVISLQENNHNYSELLIRHSQTIVLGVTNSAIKIHGIVTIPK